MKVLLVDDHPVARRGLEVVVALALPGSEILEADNANTALEIARATQPEMILLDARLPGSAPANEVCRDLRELLPRASIVIVTAFDELDVIRACLSSGASGCLLKDTSEVDIAAALEELLAGEIVIDPRIANRLARRAVERDRLPELHLTDRERDVLALLAEGCSNRKIAERLFLSETTVKGYVTDLLQKLHASSRLEAVVRSYELGIIAQPNPR